MSEVEEISNKLYQTHMLPVWFDVVSAVLVLGAFVVFMFTAHVLYKRGEVGGGSMVICGYFSILFAVAPSLVGLEVEGRMTGEPYLLLRFSEILSYLFLFLSVTHLLRSVYARSS